ncbi:M14 family metallopeptidase [Portibacter marinus]|uniref:M14 family metallopeptidase n=1 Tax=Portibacter marinus TaxID=2898660 RepID=UPI001F23F987|nr:M14 family metallopeptidase [Portibacter marinus]
MKFLNVFLVVLWCANGLSGQEMFHRVKVDLEGSDIQKLRQLGIETDHGLLKKGKFFVNDLSDSELDLVSEAGLNFEILISDVQSYYVSQNKESELQVRTRSEHCNELIYSYKTPENYTYGSMGGYHTYEELLVVLDSMHSRFPDLISKRQPIDSIKTFENRPIYYMTIGSNLNREGVGKPEILYTALHHAREPNSLSQMLFFMWYLLENYEQDELIRFIVDHTELYFIPCVNPDGYVYNQETHPSGGGLWRKNRSEVNGLVAGVDLNRNYGYEWAYDDEGSSDNPNSNTYRGPAPFSEPETRAVSQLCLDHDFKVVLNYHTYGNLLIYPWGYNNEATTDDLTFKGISKAMTSENDFLAGTGIETVGYKVNGDADDWMYGHLDILAVTPEVGSSDFGFWPPIAKIDHLNKSALKQNLVSALILHDYTLPTRLRRSADEIKFRIAKYGLQSGEIKVRVESLDDALVFDDISFEQEMEHLESDTLFFSYSIDEDLITSEKPLQYVLHRVHKGYAISDTFELFTPVHLEEIFADPGVDLEQWNSEEWGISEEVYVSGPSSITDSPEGRYPAATTTELVMIDSLPLINYDAAVLEFEAIWDIEEDFDYAQVLISTNGVDYEALCGTYSERGTIFQKNEEPVYEGTIEEWVTETIDISSYIGNAIWIKFTMTADDFQHQDGIYIDDVFVRVLNQDTSSSVFETASKYAQVLILPNPAIDILEVKASGNVAEVVIYDGLGRVVSSHRTHRIRVAHLNPGIYFARVKQTDGQILQSKFFKI